MQSTNTRRTDTESPTTNVALQRVPDWAASVTRLLDDLIRIPGTNIGIGLDAIVGFLLPGIGDALTAVGALSLLIVAVRMRVPRVVLARMVLNIAIDTLIGAVPLLGDVFDLVWKANRKNLDLLMRYEDEPNAQPTFGDYALLALAVFLLVLSVIVPVVLAMLLATWLASLFHGAA